MKKVFLLIIIVIFVITGMSWQKEASVLETIKESALPEFETTEEQEQAVPNIRVLIMTDGYKGEVHPEVVLSSKTDLSIRYGEAEEVIKAGEEFCLKADDAKFKEGNIYVSSEKKIKLEHLTRGYGSPSYEGVIELRKTAEGIVIINELSVEKYLKAVVPSEMPASYELEALKAQAVCARSYAYRQMEEYGYPEYEAHVNDSTDYQVYGNSKTYKRSNQAVKETNGQVVYYRDEIATTYYFSTSCGVTTDITAWGTKKKESNGYLKSVQVSGKKGDYEKELPWYKWSAEIPVETLSDLVGLSTGKDIGEILKIKVTERGAGDIALEMKISGEKGTVTVSTENKIRTVLGGTGYQIKLQDGTMTDSRSLLPSAFFTVKKTGDVFVIKGGGFGHGIGMSQNGANEMAKQGKDYMEILELFYQDIEVR